MLKGKIEKYFFELDKENSRIVIYENGDIDPLGFINNININSIDEKDFHYEIMHWFMTNNTQ
jgi:hypothetical protein